jgi:hypothetical protein
VPRSPHKNVPKPVVFNYNIQMIWLRKGFVHLLSIVLLVSLLGGAAAISFDRSLSHPGKLEGWLADSKIYDHLPAATLVQTQKSGTDGGPGSISLNDPAVRQAAQTAFPPDLLRHSANTFLDSNYDWLAGKTATPSFSIDFSAAKQNFAKLVGQAAAAHLAALPACTPAQLAQLSIPVDSLSVSCRPAILTAQAEGARITEAVGNSNDLLSDPVVTAGSLNQDIKNSQGLPYYQKLSWAPRAYRITLKLPWILGALALLSGLGIVFIALSRRRGARRIGAVLLLAGIILIVEKFVADALVKKFANTTLHNTLGSQLKQPISDLLHKGEPQLVQPYLWFGILFLIAGLLILTIIFKTRGPNAKPKTPGTDADSPPTDADDIRLAPRRRQPSGTAGLKPMPPRPKRPRLIQ